MTDLIRQDGRIAWTPSNKLDKKEIICEHYSENSNTSPQQKKFKSWKKNVWKHRSHAQNVFGNKWNDHTFIKKNTTL